MKVSKLRLLVTAAPLAATLLSTPLSAQEVANDTGGIEEIVVTAQRREENLQNVPISVSAFSGEQLKAQGTTDISRLENIVPGFAFGRSGPDARPAIRGVRTENVGVNGDTTIGFFIDGVYQSRASQATLSFVDIERVEIQRGPQGTLYGRNTFGGNIAITTAQPTLEEYKGGIDLTVGENGRFRTEGFVNAALSETIALRMAGAYEDSSGYVKNDNPLGNNLFDDRSRYIRGSVLFQPSEAFSAVLKFDYAQQRGAGGSAFGYKLRGSYFYTPTSTQLYNGTVVVLNTRGGNRDLVVDAPLTIDAGVPIYQPNDPYRTDTDQPTLLDLRNYGWSANLAYDFGGVTLKSITGYTDFEATRTADSDFSANQIAIDSQLTGAKTFTQELQLVSDGSGPLTYVLGGYYFKDKLQSVLINQQSPLIIRNVTPNIVGTSFRGGFYDEQRAETQSLAAYAQASYELTEQLKFTVGARYTRDRKDFQFANANAVLPLIGGTTPDGTFIRLGLPAIPDSAFGAAGAATNCTYANISNTVGSTVPAPRPGFRCLIANTAVLTGATYDTATFKRMTWRVGLDYQIAEDSLLYASASSGFRSGGFNSGQNQAALQPTFAPEKVLAFELGSKNRFADNTIQLNLAAFYNRYDGLQEQRQVPVGPATLSVIENSGKARSYGLEVEAIWKPVDALTLGFSGSFLDAKYTEYTNVPAPFGTTILVADATALTATVVNGVTIAAAGQRRLFAPGYDCGLVPGTGAAGQPAAAYGCDLSGNSIPHSPKYSGAVYASYAIDLGSAGTLTPYAVMTFSGAFFGQPFNSILERQDAYTKVDLRLTWALNESFELQAFVNNLTNQATANRFVWGGGGALQASYAPPRLWGARASLKF